MSVCLDIQSFREPWGQKLFIWTVDQDDNVLDLTVRQVRVEDGKRVLRDGWGKPIYPGF